LARFRLVSEDNDSRTIWTVVLQQRQNASIESNELPLSVYGKSQKVCVRNLLVSCKSFGKRFNSLDKTDGVCPEAVSWVTQVGR